MKTSSVNQDEIEFFSSLADEWWDEGGKFKTLHDINPTRLEFIVDNAGELSGKKLLDIGCGGGLLCEPLARIGADVTGIDASEKNIKVASLHAEKSNLDINYINTTAEDLAAKKQKYDVITALEIIEHVENPAEFVKNCTSMLKPGGTIFFSTLNRTLKSLAMAKIAAEYILRIMPAGTHSWKKFVRPHELSEMLEAADYKIEKMAGIVLNPIKFQWGLSEKDLDVNYILAARKRKKA